MGLKLVIVAGTQVRTPLCLALENLGYDVAQFSTVTDLLTAVDRRSPDALLVDLTSGATNGTSCVHDIRRDHDDVPILLLGTPPT